MIRLIKSNVVPCVIDGQSVSMAMMTLVGLAGDEKPVGSYGDILIANGSKFITIGGSSYTYDEENQTWVQDAGGSGAGGSGGGVSDDLATQILQIITLASGSAPVTRVVVEDAADTTIVADAWNKEYVVPGTSLESLAIQLPATTPTAVSSCIKVTILGITRHADPESEDPNDPDMLPPSITLPQGVVFIGGMPEYDGDGWELLIDNNLFATGTVFPNPPAEEEQSGGE